MISYAGIGARATPGDVLKRMKQLGRYLAVQGCMLHSGGSQGADQAFEEGCDEAQGLKQIFLPWRFYRNNPSPLCQPSQKARLIAQKYHPKWEFLLPATRDLMARNSHQLLGVDCNSPVRFVVCWTRNGEIEGGTGQALRIAQDLKIPVLNFGNMDLNTISDRVQELIQ